MEGAADILPKLWLANLCFHPDVLTNLNILVKGIEGIWDIAKMLLVSAEPRFAIAYQSRTFANEHNCLKQY